MGKQFSLFVKILLILIIFVILFPQIIDSLVNMFMIEEKNNRPRGNSTFVSSPCSEEKNELKENLLYMVRCFVK